MDEDGKESSFSWFCSGIRKRSQHELANLKNFVAFHDDTLGRACTLTLAKYHHPLNLWTENTNSIVQHFGMVLTIFVHSTLMKSGIYMVVSKSITLETLELKSLMQDLMNHKDIL